MHVLNKYKSYEVTWFCDFSRDLYNHYYHLPLCTEKSVCLHYGHTNPKNSYFVNGDTIKSMLECADLGIMQSTNFDYRQHIDKIC